jgi:hypothetical protein
MRPVLASPNRRPEDIRILPIVVAELELGDIERHIFTAHFVECADNAALEDRPEAFNGLSMDCTDDILAFGVVNNAVRIFPIEPLVATPLIRAKQADFMRDSFADERSKSVRSDIRDDARNNVAFAADSADDWRFAGTDPAGPASTAAFIPMPVFGQAADESFIDLDNAAELIDVFHKGDADLMAHGPSCLIRAKPHDALHLEGRNALLTGQHHVNNAEPVTKRLVCVFEDCPGDDRKPVAVWRALFALPLPFSGFEVINSWVATTRTADSVRPSTGFEIAFACILMREHGIELSDGQLMNRLRLFGAGHDGLSIAGRY